MIKITKNINEAFGIINLIAVAMAPRSAPMFNVFAKNKRIVQT